MHVSRCPSAWFVSTAATAESTPPLSAQMAWSSGPSSARMRGDHLLYEAARRPVALEAGHVEQEAFQELATACRVHDLGVKLNAVQSPLWIGDGRKRRVLAVGDGAKPGRQLRKSVAVAHPHGRRLARGKARKQAHGFVDHEVCGAVFALARGLHLAPELQRHELLAVADAERRQPQFEQPGIALRRVLRVHAVGSAAENQRARILGAHFVERRGARQDLAVDLAFPHPASDELRVLGAVVEDEDRWPGRHLRRLARSADAEKRPVALATLAALRTPKRASLP